MTDVSQPTAKILPFPIRKNAVLEKYSGDIRRQAHQR
jgi:hypothetical protein